GELLGGAPGAVDRALLGERDAGREERGVLDDVRRGVELERALLALALVPDAEGRDDDRVARRARDLELEDLAARLPLLLELEPVSGPRALLRSGERLRGELGAALEGLEELRREQLLRCLAERALRLGAGAAALEADLRVELDLAAALRAQLEGGERARLDARREPGGDLVGGVAVLPDERELLAGERDAADGALVVRDGEALDRPLLEVEVGGDGRRLLGREGLLRLVDAARLDELLDGDQVALDGDDARVRGAGLLRRVLVAARAPDEHGPVALLRPLEGGEGELRLIRARGGGRGRRERGREREERAAASHSSSSFFFFFFFESCSAVLPHSVLSSSP